jgi:hypothetical protein
MAGVIGLYSNATGIALTAATAKTVIQITAPTNQLLFLQEVMIGFAGTFADGDDIKVRFMRQTTAGTMTAATEVHADSGRNLTLQGAVTHTSTAEPTNSDELKVHYHSAFHQRTMRLVFGPREFPIVEATRVGIEITSDAAATCYPAIRWEE